MLSASYREQYKTALQETNKDLNAFTYFSDLAEAASAATDLAVPFAVKANIAVKDRPLTCASRLLEQVTSPIDSSVFAALSRSGAQLAGITNMDEFGMGSSTIHSIFGRTNNPWDTGRSPGGSSGGSASAVAAGMVPFALGSDTGGSIRQPAMFCGVWGLKPSYGAVSRYGLVAYSSSLDVIGIIAEDPQWLETVFSTIRVKGRDALDASSYYPSTEPSDTTKRIAYFVPDEDVSEETKQSVLCAVEAYKKAGYEVTKIDLSLFRYAAAVYMTISTAEASSNLARFDGIRYGSRGGGFAEDGANLIRTARNKGFASEVKLRVLTGAYVLRSGFQDQYYTKALALRSRIRRTLLSVFSNYDLLVLPVFPTQSFSFDDDSMDDFRQKQGDTFSVVANLSGLPAAACPVAWHNGLPSGIQVVGPRYAEKRICRFLCATKDLFEHRHSPYAKSFFEKTERGQEDR